MAWNVESFGRRPFHSQISTLLCRRFENQHHIVALVFMRLSVACNSVACRKQYDVISLEQKSARASLITVEWWAGTEQNSKKIRWTD